MNYVKILRYSSAFRSLNRKYFPAKPSVMDCSLFHWTRIGGNWRSNCCEQVSWRVTEQYYIIYGLYHSDKVQGTQGLFTLTCSSQPIHQRYTAVWFQFFLHVWSQVGSSKTLTSPSSSSSLPPSLSSNVTAVLENNSEMGILYLLAVSRHNSLLTNRWRNGDSVV